MGAQWIQPGSWGTVCVTQISLTELRYLLAKAIHAVPICQLLFVFKAWVRLAKVRGEWIQITLFLKQSQLFGTLETLAL